MSFSSKVKGEIGRYTDLTKTEALAEISAIMKVGGTLGFSGKGLSFKITTENPASARVIFTILKEYFDIHSKLMVKKSTSLKKNNIYMVVITEEMGVRELLRKTGILKEIDGTYVCNPGSPILPRDKTKGTYLIIKMDESKIDFEFKYL